ncbi:acylphosphatase-2 isoform X1 [Eurosta solidaginis]|uniref:acylphosphatase-2 isoform X1 n=1 Tax=Eurosta solidaginis TaxID=178769 RepID=UPI003530A782
MKPFFRHITLKYDNDTCYMIKQYNNFHKKLAKQQQRLKFLLNCKDYGITPPHLKGKTSKLIHCFKLDTTKNELGCYFTKYARQLCTKAGIKGWIKNSKQGTILGKMQGTKEEIDKMVIWLSKEGSPGCKIEKCVLRNSTTINKLDYKDFAIRF